ncbi:response regulator [Roseisolibacter sp. H3M3-2]|uniref:LytR/AlgR family response regulator transcription factor n=1 Tax=Roseisolibacter sp. H3M3-2 TaxID=3031323 RepID=UPI0023DC312F|nr:response regulator [Roseisolibacter sp. H3M3-2]MDF1501919.1 response regulator [Roseisolibacter sp. H3M3-2]
MSGAALDVLVVDDEPLARAGVRALLAEQPEVGAVREARDGEAAVAAIRERRPDLVFLDVQMPRLDGFGVVEAVGAGAMPPVVFVTAYDAHAVRAFEVHAVDYLLKPVDPARFRDAFVRAARAAAGGGAAALRAATGS